MPFHICGARGPNREPDETLGVLKAFCEEEDCEGQIIDAEMVFGKEHIRSAYEHAKRAFANGTNSSKSLATEILLYASGERQIVAAIKKLGITDGTTSYCVLLIGDAEPDRLIRRLGFKRDDALLEGDVKNLKAYGISKKEMGTVPEDEVFDLVLERVAMVDLLK